MTSNQKQGFLCIAFTTLMFSLMEIALKFISGDLNPIQINFSRFLFGGLVLLPFALRKLNHLKAQGVYMEKQDLLYFAFLGFVGMAVSRTLDQLSFFYANASVVAVLVSSNPLVVLVLAYLILKEPIHIRKIVALVLDFVGIIFIFDPLNMHVELLGVILT